MHFHIADVYADTGSPVHRMDPRLKLVTGLALIVFIGLTPVGAFGAYLGFFTLIMALVLVSRLDPWLVARRSLVALPFAAAAITLMFTVPGRTLGTVPLTGWTISEAGLVRFVSIMFKSMISVQVAVLLILSTHLSDILWALGALRVPRILVAIVSFMYRYLFLMAEEAARLTRARDSRSAFVGGNPAPTRSILFRARTTGRMVGNLFVRSLERSERVYGAMVARGYQGVVRQLTPPTIRLTEVASAAGVLLLGLVLMMFGILW